MVSIIVPVYNIKEYLSVCLESVINQTYNNLEIILVDDGSTDGSGDICDEYARKDYRVKVVHKKNEGLVRARKTGIMASSGKFIAYVDGDDWIEPNMVERLRQVLEEEKVDIAMCGRFEDTGAMSRPVYQGLRAGIYHKERLVAEVYPKMIVNGGFFEWGLFPSVWDKLFRRECIESFQLAVDDSLTMGEDAACTYPALLNAKSIYILDECLYHYRQTGTSMVKRSEDIEVLRNRFSKLYTSVRDVFCKYKDIYDLREQWKEYLLFLMVPRAHTLYRGIEELDYLFPFPNVKKGSNVIIYGMGTYGQHLYKFLKDTGFCNVVTCVDRNYIELRKQGICVESVDAIGGYDYDAIVVANSFQNTREAIYNDLTKLYDTTKIHVMDEKLIKTNVTLDAFGMS